MSKDAHTSKPRRGKLKITHEVVVDIINYAIETDGVDKADVFFGQMNKYCSIVDGWPEVVKEVRSTIAEAKKALQQEQFARELALRKAAAPNVLVTNLNEAYGLKESKRISNRDVTMTGEHATYEENTIPNE
jgi:hypothetical protein